MRTVNHYIKIQIANGMTAEKREVNGAIEAVMSVASGQLKKNGSFNITEMYVQPVVEDPVAGGKDPRGKAMPAPRHIPVQTWCTVCVKRQTQS